MSKVCNKLQMPGRQGYVTMDRLRTPVKTTPTASRNFLSLLFIRTERNRNLTDAPSDDSLCK